SHVTAEFFVIIEIFLFQQAVFIAQQPICLDFARIELNLYFYILGDRKKRAAKFGNHGFASLGDVVDIGVISMALISQQFHLAVFQIAHAESQHGKAYAALPFPCDELLHVAVAGWAYVEVPIGSEDDAVISSFDNMLPGDAVGELQAGASCRRPTGM